VDLNTSDDRCSDTESLITSASSRVVLFIEVFALVFLILLSVLSCYILLRDVVLFIDLNVTYVQLTDIVLNDVFMLIIMAELIRFILALRADPKGRIIWLAEVGLIVCIREVIIASISKEALSMLLSAIATLVLTAVIWMARTKILRD